MNNSNRPLVQSLRLFRAERQGDYKSSAVIKLALVFIVLAIFLGVIYFLTPVSPQLFH